jgi:hypothetical protein
VYLLALARGALPSLACASLGARQDAEGVVQVAGYVSSVDDRRKVEAAVRAVVPVDKLLVALDVHPWPICAGLGLKTTASSPDILVGAHRTSLPQLVEGEHLTADARGPAGRFLSVWYLTLDGKAIRLWPFTEAEDVRLASAASVKIGARSDHPRFRVSGPLGQELLVAVATPSPVAPASEPIEQPAGPLLDRLAGVLDGGGAELGRVLLTVRAAGSH